MNSLSVIKAIKEFFAGTTGAEMAILIFIVLNILITIFNSWVQFRLKMKDRKNIGFKIREEKKVVIYEKAFSQMQELNYANPEINKDGFLDLIINLEKYKELNRLYICDKTSKVITEFCDYCKTILTDYRKKDLNKEEKYVNTFKKLYIK